MSDLVIRAERLGKLYTLGERTHARYRTLRDTVTDAAARPFRWLRGGRARRPKPEHLWALRDVSFEVGRGEVVGIIGRNGAGKSTLLKLLSRITEPTTGRAEIRGRVGSLLEVGTGFHHELTGRENIYLNGAILGMRKVEIDRKFDEIVEFAEIEKFLDTPVKHYSSGMYVRLAFAVAAHLEPEILLVDEVLAVGDAAFQAKCLRKMGEVSEAGRTILFVSHNLPVVQKLCPRAILFEDGRTTGDGPASQIIDAYLSGATTSMLQFGAQVDLTGARRWGGSGEARITRVTMFDPHDTARRAASFRGGDLGFTISLAGDLERVRAAGVQITDLHGRKLINVNTLEKGDVLALQPGQEVVFSIERVALRPGNYTVGFWLGAAETRHIDVVAEACTLQVLPPEGASWVSAHDGVFACPFSYEVR